MGIVLHIKKIAIFALSTISLLLVIVDRWSMALVSQWREDQATNLYIGYHFFDWSTPVGLISSTGIPNPNGMVLLGALLSRLPGLLAVSGDSGNSTPFRYPCNLPLTLVCPPSVV